MIEYVIIQANIIVLNDDKHFKLGSPEAVRGYWESFIDQQADEDGFVSYPCRKQNMKIIATGTYPDLPGADKEHIAEIKKLKKKLKKQNKGAK
tara:strand:+ start:152 stop:430 length:279 start_codon:yes stop_codon:yes gene_type:complete